MHNLKLRQLHIFEIILKDGENTLRWEIIQIKNNKGMNEEENEIIKSDERRRKMKKD